MQPLLKRQWYFSQKYKKAIINIVQNHNRPQTAKALLRKKKPEATMFLISSHTSKL